MSKMKIHNYQYFMRSVIAAFRDEALKVLKSFPEFTEEYEKIFHVEAVPSAVVFIEDEIINSNHDKKNFSRKFIINTYNDGILMRATTPCKAHMYSKTDDKGKIKIVELVIRINYDVLLVDALKHLHEINQYINVVIKDHARHEAGHIIDYIKRYEGQSPELLKKDTEQYIKDSNEWLDWWKSISDNGSKSLTKEQDKERLLKYFSIPTEALADQYGGVDREKNIDYVLSKTGQIVDIVIKSKTRPVEEIAK